MAIPIPPYDILKQNFPAKDLVDVKNLIGGNVNRDYIENACAIRVSRALNYSGAPLPRGGKNFFSGTREFVTVSGADGKWYALRMAELRKYLTQTHGPPDLTTHEKTPPQEWRHTRGIIAFEVKGWSNATGHMDLWNGLGCEYKEYWAQSFEVVLWAAESPLAVMKFHWNRMLDSVL